MCLDHQRFEAALRQMQVVSGQTPQDDAMEETPLTPLKEPTTNERVFVAGEPVSFAELTEDHFDRMTDEEYEV